jgi:hypothetical protein
LVNALFFDVEFIKKDPKADGIFTVMIDDDTIATIRESELGEGVHTQQYTFPLKVESESHELTFRLVPTTKAKSNLSLKNVRTGLVADALSEEEYKTVAWLQNLPPTGQVVKLGAGGTAEPVSTVDSSEETYEINNLSSFPSLQSETGEVVVGGNTITLDASDGPAWVSINYHSDKPFDAFRFYLDFPKSDEGSEGLLSVYINDQEYRQFDERYALPNYEEFIAFYGDQFPDDFTITFRLDSYTSVPSKVVISDIKRSLTEIIETPIE